MSFTILHSMWCPSSEPNDDFKAVHYNVTFCPTVSTDGDYPASTALSSPFLINVVDDDIFEGVEQFQARIVKTSDKLRVRIGPQSAINITITYDDRELTNLIFRIWVHVESNETVNSIIIESPLSTGITLSYQWHDNWTCTISWTILYEKRKSNDHTSLLRCQLECSV